MCPRPQQALASKSKGDRHPRAFVKAPVDEEVVMPMRRTNAAESFETQRPEPVARNRTPSPASERKPEAFWRFSFFIWGLPLLIFILIAVLKSVLGS
jgi:hypothetical protein